MSYSDHSLHVSKTEVPPPASLQSPQEWEENVKEWGCGQAWGSEPVLSVTMVPEGSVCAEDNGWKLKPAFPLRALTLTRTR